MRNHRSENRQNIFRILWILLFLSSFLARGFTETALADIKELEGEIVKMDSASGTFQIAQSPIQITVSPATQFSGADSLSEFRVGDEVLVEAQLNKKTNLWEARSVALTKVKIHQPAF